MPKSAPVAETPKAAPSLKALAEGKTEGITKATTFRVDPRLIKFEDGFNLRSEGDELDLHINRLYLAVKAGAFIPPIDVSVVNGEIIARDGHCRTKAAVRIREEMPEYTLECRQLRGNDSDAVLHMLGTGSGSKPLTPLEQGRGFLRLINMGLKATEIAAKLGLTRVTIDNGLALAEAPQEVQKMITDGEVSSTVAREALKAGPDAVTALKDAVVTQRAKAATPAKKGAKKVAKKKVTAKALKGTAADKTKTKKPKKGSSDDVMDGPSLASQQSSGEQEASTTVLASLPNPNEVVIKIPRGTAIVAAEFLRGFGGDDADLKILASALEMVVM